MAEPSPTESQADKRARLLRILRSQGYMIAGRTGDIGLRFKYALSRREVCRLMEEQDGYCALCGWDLDQAKPGQAKRPKWAVDHDDTRFKVRGILCYSCNTGLGQVGGRRNSSEKAIVGLKRAIAYLERFLERS